MLRKELDPSVAVSPPGPVSRSGVVLLSQPSPARYTTEELAPALCPRQLPLSSCHFTARANGSPEGEPCPLRQVEITPHGPCGGSCQPH